MISHKHVTYVPKQLEPGILYISTEYAVAAHLCACGCGNKVVTPLGPAEWSFSERNGRATLRPSIGNWQLPCRSHYVITDGNIKWGGQWSDAKVKAGRRAEEARRQAYYASLDRARGFWGRIGKWVRGLFGR
jgi:hypothetical protein